MKKQEIVEGGKYLAKVSGRLVTVRVDKIRETSKFRRNNYSGKSEYGDATVYDVTNLDTGRKIIFRSAQKFRAVVTVDLPLPAVIHQEFPVLRDEPTAEDRRLEQIENKYSTEAGATEEERQEAQTIVEKKMALKALKLPAPTLELVEPVPPLVYFSTGGGVGQRFSNDERPTPEQEAILQAAASDAKVLVIEAGAGTGKTTSLKMIGRVLPGNGQYTAFNSALVHESAEKFKGSKVACNTTHSLAFRAVGKTFAHRLNQGRVKSEVIARTLGIESQTLRVDDGTPDGQVRVLSAGFLASQVMGAIRRFCQSADPEVTSKHFKYLDGIDNPIDGHRTYANNERLRDYLLPFAQKAWADLSDPQGTLPFTHDHYVKVWQLSKPVIAADYVLLDECFPAGTMVETSIGSVPIEQIVETPEVEWRVLARVYGGRTLGYSRVKRAYKTPAHSLVRIVHAQGEFVCTANHPLWVEGQGWKPAGLVSSGDSLSRLLSADQEGAAVLLSEMRCEVAGIEQGPRDGATAQGEDFQADEASSQGDSQSDAQSSPSEEDARYYAETGRSVYGSDSGRERSAVALRAFPVQGIGSTPTEMALEPRACRLYWSRPAEEGRLSERLQGRSCSPAIQDRCGNRRGQPSQRLLEGQGCEEDARLGVSRVVRVEVYQPAGQGRPTGDGDGSHQEVYTLAVEAGNYFADGVLVKNCQDTAEVMLDVLRQQVEAGVRVILVGDSAQQIYEWRGAVNAMASFPDAERCYLSQSFRFGPAIAAVANAVLETLEEATPLRLKGLETIDSKVQEIKEPTAILCRTNAVAVSNLLEAIAAGKKPYLVGGGSDVIAFVEAAESLQEGRPTGHPDLACFGSWQEVQKYAKEDEGEDLRLLVKLIDSFGCRPILDALKSMPKEEKADLVISTAHKSKGRAWSKVKLAADFPTKSKCCDADRKLLYVAVTRARHELDVTGCPFFTGQDSLDVSQLIKATERHAEAPSILPQAPRPQAKEFTWSKRDGAWCVRGPAGFSGKTVSVVRKDGSMQAKVLREVVADYPEATIYRV